MSWVKKTEKTTAHNHKSNFGRLVDNCPRCKELKAGAPAVIWYGRNKSEREAEFTRALKAHDCIKSNCGPVCTFGDW
jgi:NAD-dependent SIR2 family protein deacetylase